MFRYLPLWLMLACGEDADGDGFDVNEDCDDETFAVNPSGIEACNGVDDDCDTDTPDAG